MSLALWARCRAGDALRAVRSRPVLFVLCVLVGPLSVLALSLAVPARYQATAEIRLSLPALDRETVRLLDIPPDSTPTAAALPDSPAAGTEARRAIVNRAAADAGVTRAFLEDAVDIGTVEPINGGLATPATQGRLTVSGVASDPHRASRLVNAYADAYLAVRRELVALRAHEARKRAMILISATPDHPDPSPSASRQLKLLPLLEQLNVTTDRKARPSAASITSEPIRNTVAAAILSLWCGLAITMLATRRSRTLLAR